MRKGNLVKLNKSTCFTTRNGGSLEYPLTHNMNDDDHVVDGCRHLTPGELKDWRNSDASKGMMDAGESKLPPTCAFVTVHEDDIMIVERARCREAFGYYSPTGGWTKVLNPKTGASSYVKRGLLEVFSSFS